MDLGVSCHVFGNLLWDILEDDLPGNRDAGMILLNRIITCIYNENGTPSNDRIPKLESSDLAKSNEFYPWLKHVKGRRVRKFAAVALRLAEDHKSNLVRTHHRYECVKALNDVYDMCDRSETRWPHDVQTRFSDAMLALLGHYGWLAKDAMSRGLRRYSIVQKHHLAAHLPEQAKWIAPRCSWTYGSESFMGLCAKITASCMKGVQAASVSHKFVEKFSMAFHLMLNDLIVFGDTE
eukprot:9474768-Pyramimonas_sp.AAC.2